MAYTKQIESKAIYGDEITAIIGEEDAMSAVDQPLPTSVPSAKGLHEAEQRVGKAPDVMQFLDYLEDNQIDGTRSDLSDVVKELKQGSASQILDLFREMLRQKKSQHGVSTENVVDGQRKRKQSEPVNVQPEMKRARVAGVKANASGVAKFGIGERVEADTVVFGSKYAEANPGSITGTVVAKESGGIIRVLWDEDSDRGVDAALRSHWKHLKPVQGSEEVNQAHVAYLLRCSLGPVSRMETKVFHIFMSLERAITRREMYESNKTNCSTPRVGGNALFSTIGVHGFKPSIQR